MRSKKRKNIPETSKTANILDPIQPGLDPEVFDSPEAEEPRLKGPIAQWVKSQVHQVLLNNGYDAPSGWLRLVLTGSLTTYQWSAESDFDISLWVGDTSNLPLDEEHQSWRANLVRVVIDNLDGTIVPGTTHPLQCFVVDKDRFTQFSDIYQPGLRSAWDIDTAEWIQPPERERTIDVRAKFPDLYHRGLAAADKMKLLLKYDKARAGVYWNYLHHRRRTDMLAGRGDYADSNIVYKMLANSGMFEGISEATGQYIASNDVCPRSGTELRPQDTVIFNADCGRNYSGSVDWVKGHPNRCPGPEGKGHINQHLDWDWYGDPRYTENQHFKSRACKGWIRSVRCGDCGGNVKYHHGQGTLTNHKPKTKDSAQRTATPKQWDMAGKDLNWDDMDAAHKRGEHSEVNPMWDCPSCVRENLNDPMFETMDPRYPGFKPEAATQETYPCPGDCGGALTKRPNTKLFVFEKEITRGGDPRYPVREKAVEDRNRSIWDCDTCGQSWFGMGKRSSKDYSVYTEMCRTCQGTGLRKHPNDPRGQECPSCEGLGEVPDINCEECDSHLSPRPNVTDGEDQGGTTWECDNCGTEHYSDTDFYKDSSVNPHTPEEGVARGTAWTDHLPNEYGETFFDGPRQYNDQVDGKYICQCGFSTDNEPRPEDNGQPLCNYCRAVGHLNGLLYGDQLSPGDSHDGEQSKMEQYKNWWKKSNRDVCFNCGLSYGPDEGDDPHNHPFAPGDVHPIQCWCGYSDDYHHSFQSDSDPRYEPVWPR